MRSAIRWLAQASCIWGVLLLAALAGNSYSWMYEMAPSIPRGAIEDASGNEAVLATMVFLAIAAWHAGRDAHRRDGWRC